jgi:hypothetical protein
VTFCSLGFFQNSMSIVCQMEEGLKNSLSYIIVPSISFLISWILVTHCFTLCDIFQPEWYKKKCVVASTRAMTFQEYIQLLKVNLQNLQILFLLFLTCVYIRFWIFGQQSLFYTIFGNSMGWLPEALFEISGATICGEIWFFLGHHFAHMPPMEHWHKKHHEYSETSFALVGLYCSWEEMCLLNFPLGLGWAILVKMNYLTLALWLVLVAWHIAHDHSSHKLIPNIIDDPAYHLEHHRNRNCNYGANWVYKLVSYCGISHERNE